MANRNIIAPLSEGELQDLNRDDTTVKHTAKDSVFCDVFSDKVNVLDAYKEFHPEDTKATTDDIWVNTLKTVLVNHVYNDLGFYVNKDGEAKFVFLVEEQSYWNPNMTLRLLWYLCEILRRFIRQTKQRVHGNTRVRLPKIELYIVYTGDGDAPDEISFKDDYFGGDCPVDLRAKILKKPSKDTVIGQYIGYSKIYNEQKKIYGDSVKCAEETVRLSIESGYLVDYLTKQREEVITMMAELFDEERLREEDNEALRAEGKAEGIAEGEAREKISIALRMLKKGRDTLQEIAEDTGLPLSKVQELANGNLTIA